MRSGTPTEKKHAQRIAPVQLMSTHVTPADKTPMAGFTKALHVVSDTREC